MKLIVAIAAVCTATVCASANSAPAVAHGHGGGGHCHGGGGHCHGGGHYGGSGFSGGHWGGQQSMYGGWSRSGMACSMNGARHHQLNPTYSWPSSGSSMNNSAATAVSASSMPPMGTAMIPVGYGSNQGAYGTIGSAPQITSMNTYDPYGMNMMPPHLRHHHHRPMQDYDNNMPNFGGESGNGFGSVSARMNNGFGNANGYPNNGWGSVSGRLNNGLGNTNGHQNSGWESPPNNGFGSLTGEPSNGQNAPLESGIF